jgi:hypothetical protein
MNWSGLRAKFLQYQGSGAMDNMAFFNRLTLAIFAKLYAAFPTPFDIDIKTVAMEVIPEDADENTTWNCLQAAEDAVDFLAQEGFLTHKGGYLEGGTVLQVRLTLKGLAILGSTPDSLEGRTPMIDRINKALASGAREAGSETVRQVTQQVLTAALAAGPALLTALGAR